MIKLKQNPKRTDGQQGFTLLEATISCAILTIGLVALLAVFAVAVGSTQTIQLDTIARQKATETLESIFTARETAQLPFAAIQNQSAGSPGIFVVGLQTLTDPGPDGLDGTADDVPAAPISVPGSTGSMTGSNASTNVISLANFKRQIQISNVNNPDGTVNSSLRQIVVTIQYQVAQGKTRTYSVQALISQYR
jgi:type II secretory pathway pseudopilin PulG